MSVSIDSAGWTNVGKSADTRVVYVSSSSGNDSNSGLSADAPVKSLSKGKSLLRNGSPDWLLLKRGDMWKESFGTWSRSGRAASEPMLISSYGTSTARPTLKSGTATVLDTNGGRVHDLAIIGIKLHAHTRDPESPDFSTTAHARALRFVGPATNILVEDCEIDAYAGTITFDDYNGRPSNIKVRRNVVTDAYSIAGERSNGLYVSGTDGLLVEGNVFDHNGWNETLSGLNNTEHNVYIQSDTTGVVVRGNVIARGGSHGLQARPGGIVQDNLFLRNPIGMSFGLVNGANAVAGGVSGDVSGNVFLDTRDINDPSRGWGYAIEVGNTKPGGGTTIQGNIIAQDSYRKSSAIQLGVGQPYNPDQHAGLNDLTIADNAVYGWYRGLSTSSSFVNGASGMYGFNDVTLRDNDFQQTSSSRMITHSHAYSSAEEHWSGNRYGDESSSSGWYLLNGSTLSFSSWQSKVESTAGKSIVSYADPTRNAATYNASLGGTASVLAFLGEARRQSRATWRPSYTASAANAYVREGFAGSSVSAAAPAAMTDVVGPTVVSTTFSTLRITIGFSEDVSASLTASDVVLKNTSTGLSVASSVLAMSYDRATNIATITFPGLSGDVLPHGSYQLSLYDQNVSDAAGNRLLGGVGGIAGDYVTRFTV